MRLLQVLAGGLLIAVTASCTEPPPPADLILTNGAIYTIDSAHPWVEAVAVRDGRYLAVGDASAIEKYRGDGTTVVDLAGRMAMPGINDAHMHPIMGGLKILFECNFDFAATPDDISTALAACARSRPGEAWIRGGQWGSSFFEQFPLDSPKAFLDELAPQHAVFLNDDSGHNGWVNSRALEIAGIDASTPDPVGGTIVRGADGEPNGVLLENAARLFDTVIPPWADEQYAAAARESARIANAFGITGLKDAGAFDPAALAFGLVDKAGELTLHAATCMLTPYGHREEALDYAAIAAERDRYATDHVHTNFVKLFLDGVPTPARTAAMLAPYVADATHGDNFTGGLHIAPDLLTADVIKLDEMGFTMKIHTTGDRSVRVALDAIEAARNANGDSGLRHELAHAGYVHPQDVARFSQLNVVADFSPYIFSPSPIIQAVISAVGSERGSRYWPTRDLLDAGAHIAAGSDWPAAVPSANPWLGIEALVTRKDPTASTPGTLWAEQRIELDEALEIFTIAGARALRLDQLTGSVEVGKSADIIVLNHNLFEVQPEQLGDTTVHQTYFEGKLVYAADRSSSVTAID